MKISIVIPCYDMFSWGANFLAYSLDILETQTFKDFEVVIADQSADDRIENVAKEHSEILDIVYIKNRTKGPCANLNLALPNCNGEIIRLLFQDDYLLHQDSLKLLAEGFDYNKKWAASAYVHSKDRKIFYNIHIPSVSENMYLNNTIGTPSCVSFLKDEREEFDINLNWFMDADYYYRLYKKLGEPAVFDKPDFVQFIWGGQMTNSMITQELVNKEKTYLEKKYAP